MTKLNILQNRRLITFALLAITLIFGGLAVFLAITINNRNVNPDDTAAETRTCRTRTRTGVEYCPSGRSRIYTNCEVCHPESGCTEREECISADEPEPNKVFCRSEDRPAGSATCGGRAFKVDIYCVSCSGEVNCEPRNVVCQGDGDGGNPGNPGNPACPKSAIPNCGSGNAQTGETCSCTSTSPTDPFTGVQRCLDTGWGICARVDGQQPPSGGCPAGTTLVNGACLSPCDGTKNICACGTNACSGTAGQAFKCGSDGGCELENSGAWRGQGDCRVATGPNGAVGTCARAEFRNCNPAEGKMCWCSGLGSVISGYRYGNVTFRDIGQCGSSCVGKAGGIYTAESCGNPYRCPETPTFTPRYCIPINYCDRATYERVIQPCNADGTPGTLTRTPEVCSSCPVTYKCEACEKVGLDCNDNEVSRNRDDNFCGCSVQQQADRCESMTVTFGDRTLTVNNAGQSNIIYSMPTPGQQISFNSRSTGPNAGMQSYWMRPYIADQTHPANVDGTPEHFCSFYVFNPYQDQNYPDPNLRHGGAASRTFTMPTNLTNLVRNDSPTSNGYFPINGVNCNNYPMNFSQGVIFGTNYIQNPTNFGGIWCRNKGPNPNMGELFDGRVKLFQQCTNPCVIRAVPAAEQAQCTGITVTNTTKNTTCNASNPTACNVSQGDVLNVTVAGSGSVTSYALSREEVRGGTATSSVSPPQETPQFNSITVPTGTNLTAFALQGSASNANGSSAPANCLVRFNFSNNPEIDKTINRTGSTPAIPTTENPVVVEGSDIVEYDVIVRNSGNSVLENVLVYDRVISLNNGQVDQNGTPIGNILRATNLARTTGTASSPESVTPAKGYTSNAVPFTGTGIDPNNSALPNDNFTSGQNIKLVRWNNITSFAPGEVYSGKVRVQIQSFTGTPGLRNQVCLVLDTNNNGQVDTGEYQRCDEVDVFTAQPEFTIEKTASATSARPGDTITYTLTLRNVSDNTLNLNNVTVTDTFDADYIGRVTVTPANGGEQQGTTNQIIWTGSDLVAANSGNANLAPDGTVSVTMQVRFNTNFFSGLTVCQVVVDNISLATSTSPDANATSTTVDINMNNPLCGNNPTGTLPPTGIDTPTYIPYLGIVVIALGVTGLLVYRRYGYKLLKNSSAGPITGESDLRKRIRIRK